jgi:hypothetical protein
MQVSTSAQAVLHYLYVAVTRADGLSVFKFVTLQAGKDVSSTRDQKGHGPYQATALMMAPTLSKISPI